MYPRAKPSRLINGTRLSPLISLPFFTPRVWRFLVCARETGGASLISLLFTAWWLQKRNLPNVAAKHGVVGFTKTIALETAQTGVTCNALCPGWVLTPLVQQQIDKRIAEGAEPEAARDALLSESSRSREFVTPEQLGELALFLCSDGAAQVRGVAWNMDGGWVAQ